MTFCRVCSIICERAAGEACVRTAMKREIAWRHGNFRRVCPVIGRLRRNFPRRISPRKANRPANVGQFSCAGVIRTEKRTGNSRPYPAKTTKKLSTIFRRKQNNGKPEHDPHSPQGVRSSAHRFQRREDRRDCQAQRRFRLRPHPSAHQKGDRHDPPRCSQVQGLP